VAPCVEEFKSEMLL